MKYLNNAIHKVLLMFVVNEKKGSLFLIYINMLRSLEV